MSVHPTSTDLRLATVPHGGGTSYPKNATGPQHTGLNHDICALIASLLPKSTIAACALASKAWYDAWVSRRVIHSTDLF